MQRKIALENTAVKSAVRYLLILIIIVQMIWPITFINPLEDGSDNPVMVIIYQALYMTLMLAGIFISRDNKALTQLLVFLGVGWLGTGIVYTFNQTASWALISGYVVIAAFQITVTIILLRYIFNAHTIDREVIYAACAVYLLFGAVFVPIFGLIETATFFSTGGLDGGLHAFSDGIIRDGEIFPWQTFIYYSYSTLTTLGYGDILPITPWARAAATFEAILGVLYITVIMARLVGLYATSEVDEVIEEFSSHTKQLYNNLNEPTD
ncbi:MAG: potassium channel family protein [Chloroflexota bacterium]